MKKCVVIFFMLCAITCFSQTKSIHVAKEKEPEVYTLVEEQAEFPGGMLALSKFIGDNVAFPKRAREDSLFQSCKVYLKFVVNEDGSTSNAEVLKGCPGYPECDKEGLRVIGIMPKWKPAKLSGREVKCYFNIPINFKIK